MSIRKEKNIYNPRVEGTTAQKSGLIFLLRFIAIIFYALLTFIGQGIVKTYYLVLNGIRGRRHSDVLKKYVKYQKMMDHYMQKSISKRLFRKKLKHLRREMFTEEERMLIFGSHIHSNGRLFRNYSKPVSHSLFIKDIKEKNYRAFQKLQKMNRPIQWFHLKWLKKRSLRLQKQRQYMKNMYQLLLQYLTFYRKRKNPGKKPHPDWHVKKLAGPLVSKVREYIRERRSRPRLNSFRDKVADSG